jgi:TonB-dependent SusC/RagA subfamily outer membrane receptor
MILLLWNFKDASALAIYGTRAANGVIIITTKKGKGDGVT